MIKISKKRIRVTIIVLLQSRMTEMPLKMEIKVTRTKTTPTRRVIEINLIRTIQTWICLKITISKAMSKPLTNQQSFIAILFQFSSNPLTTTKSKAIQ